MFRLQGISGGGKANVVADPYHRWLNKRLEPLDARDHFTGISAIYVRYRLEGDFVAINLPLGTDKTRRVRQRDYFSAHVVFPIDSWKTRTEKNFQTLFAYHVQDSYRYVTDYAEKKGMTKDADKTRNCINSIFDEFREVDFTGQHILWPGLPDSPTAPE